MFSQAASSQQGHFSFFTKNNPQRMKADRNAIRYFDEVHSSYLLDVSNKTGSLFLLNKTDFCVIYPKQLEEILYKNTSKKDCDEYDFGSDDLIELTMTRISPCETMMAIVHSSNIIIIYLPDFLKQEEPKVETNFEINEHSYAYIEWPPLNDIYCAKKHFLSLDTSGKLRTHVISDDEMFSNLDGHFRCATFSVDGGLIYAINYHQELCIIDPLNVQIISIRKMDDLQTTSTIISIQMMQITPRIMVIGSLCKSPQDPIESSVPYLLLLSGDLLDPQTKFNMFPVKMHLNQAIKPGKLPDFRFHYVKERQLLLFSHTESSRVQALQLDENGDLAELDSIDLDGASVRGFVCYKGTFSRAEKQQMVQVEYQNRRFALPNGPRILVLDNEGFMHNFNYYDTRYVLHNQSILMNPMKVEVLCGLRAVPTIIANRSMIPSSGPLTINNNMMETNPFKTEGMFGNDPYKSMKPSLFFDYKGRSKSIRGWEDEKADNPYMLDCINDIGKVVAVSGERTEIFMRTLYKNNNVGRGFVSLDILDSMLRSILRKPDFYEYQTEKDKGNIKMVRVSDCKYLVAMVYESAIHIQKIETFLEANVENREDRELKAEFMLVKGAKYSYIEWPHLNHAYIEKPYFLTRDNQGILRMHYVEECKEEIIGEGEVFLCATFSLDGRCVYAINEKQEICHIDLQDLKTVKKRIINELANAEEIISSHIQQLAPSIFAIGSMMKTQVENPENEKDFKPCLHVLCGDISDPKAEIKINLYEMTFLKTIVQKKSAIFRFLFVKERQLLLFGYSGSNEIRVLQFAIDGSQIEIDRFSIGDRTLRDIVFVKEARAANQSQTPSSSKYPKFLVLDSNGYLHHYRYHNANSSVPILPKFIKLLSIKEFLQKREILKAKLNPKKRSRGKSQDQKSAKTPATFQKKKRSKSLMKRTLTPSEIKALLGEKQRKCEPSENQAAKNPFLFVKKTNTAFSENPFLSMKKAESTPFNSLFSADLSQKNLFANSFKQQPKTETKNLISVHSKPKVLQKLFSIDSDPVKNTLMFLNKLESDITFKVEDQEFPVHKSILGERCKFFKNMFSSGMSESHSAVIEIPETKASVFKIFLTYVYLGMLAVNEELAVDFYELSERYMIGELKEACETYLGNILNLNNCFKIFEVACLYDAPLLKKEALLFFKKNLKEITERKDFGDLPKWSYIHIKRMQWDQKEITF